SEKSGSGSTDEDAGDPQMGGKVVFGLEAETTNGWCLPEGQLAISGIQVARAVYDTLTVPTGDGTFAPFLAESVSPNADYTDWSITLPPAITFHDGGPPSADDREWSCTMRPGTTFHDGSPPTAEVVRNNLDAYRGKYPGRSSL